MTSSLLTNSVSDGSPQPIAWQGGKPVSWYYQGKITNQLPTPTAEETKQSASQQMDEFVIKRLQSKLQSYESGTPQLPGAAVRSSAEISMESLTNRMRRLAKGFSASILATHGLRGGISNTSASLLT